MEENAAQPTPPPVAGFPPPQSPPPPPVAPPPVAPPPPLITPSAAKQPRRGGRGWMVLALILLVLFGFSALLNLSHIFSGLGYSKSKLTRTAGPKLDEVMYEDNSAANKSPSCRSRGS